ncbi:DUF3048 domain-containing protein [Bacillus sonorensis]|uniref:DUF3048 domain-containing protein n=1 Tax=Bacillus sonorensis TaxID=119858 RepID=UPI002852F5D3|nr:DUF3048 domain-containing protein [Bacillus sonorensis]MDR4956454.1 DUF3048 domain-containing protein [Bacillus sonorensis]
MTNRYARVLLCIACAVLLMSCQPKEKREADKNIYPLTGLEADGNVQQRPLAVVVNNHPKARPQSGLSKADIVIEALSEGPITRFLAIYQSEMPEAAGPFRSAREYFIDLALGFDGLLVHHGWSPGAKNRLKSGDSDHINGMDYDGSLFWRTDFREAPHNSYTSFKNIKKAADDKGYSMKARTEPYTFKTARAASSGTPYSARLDYGTKNVTNNVEYGYDKKAGGYVRTSDGMLTTDLETEEPVVLQNILIVEAEHQVKDTDGRRDIDLRSGGQGLLLQNGEVRQVDWKNEDGRIIPVKDGKTVPFVPGKTWINIIPDLSKVSISKGEGV